MVVTINFIRFHHNSKPLHNNYDNIKINLNYMKQPESIRLFDSKGQLVKNDLVTFSFKNTFQIHQKGLYFVVSSNKKETLIKKIIVQ